MGIMDGRCSRVEVEFFGELANIESGPITRAVLAGMLGPVVGETVNFVNAPVIAKSRGIEVVESRKSDFDDYSSLLTVRVKTEKGGAEISGTLFEGREMRIVAMGGFPMDFVPEGVVLISDHHDKPGVIGAVGTLLGNENINIAGMYVGRKTAGEKAIMVLSVDTDVPDCVIEKMVKIPGIDGVKQVRI